MLLADQGFVGHVLKSENMKKATMIGRKALKRTLVMDILTLLQTIIKQSKKKTSNYHSFRKN